MALTCYEILVIGFILTLIHTFYIDLYTHHPVKENTLWYRGSSSSMIYPYSLCYTRLSPAHLYIRKY